jgi:hypothetical protein|tara:strand:- start:58 stop:957 length:900 start_codon:yes stop_codon:yes gene_type:complete
MINEENQPGNPKVAEDAVFGSSSDDFFNALEDDVNNIVQEPEGTEQQTKATSSQSPEVKSQPVVSQDSNVNSELDNLKQRYSDSSREAQNLKAQLNELKPFVPMLDAMKRDNGLVNHVRDYFENGGKVNKNIKQQLKLDDDFNFDPDDMINNENSDSRKVFEAMVDSAVNEKTNKIMQQQQNTNQKAAYNKKISEQAETFMEKHSMTRDEFVSFTNEAQARIKQNGITFEDMYTMINQDKVNTNVANSTKSDMLNQMKNVRDIPTSASSANNAGQPNNQNDNVFEALLNSDGNIEELLG